MKNLSIRAWSIAVWMFLRQNWFSLSGLTILIIIYIRLASQLNGWLIDDAGISFSYARNLSLGFGLVSQPGVSPVEGFSNPAWVLLLSLFPIIGFDIAAIVKPLSLGISIFSILVLYLGFVRLANSKFLALAALLGLITQPAFVIWSASGLENPLLLLLISVLFYVCLLEPTAGLSVIAGFASGLAAITRPDGILFIPIHAVIHPKYLKQSLLPAIAIWGSYFIFRLVYYGEIVPNTYFMKAEGKIPSKEWLVTMWGGFKSLLLGVLGSKYVAVATLTVLFVLLTLLVWKHRIDRRYMIVGVFLSISLSSYLLLPSDWMGEYRFATPIFPFLYLFICMMIADILSFFIRQKSGPGIAAGILILGWLGVMNLISYSSRLINFSKNPTVSFYGVAANFHRFTRYATILNLDQTSVLLPDVGGALYNYPDIRIYDLGGLVDATIAHTLGRDQTGFYDYVFEVAKPDFIDLHGGWTYTANLEEDPRFRQDYIAIDEYIDPSMVLEFGDEIPSGDFVRRYLLKAHDALLMLQAVEP